MAPECPKERPVQRAKGPLLRPRPRGREEGRFRDMNNLAHALNLDWSYVHRLLRLTLLAPDIVNVISTEESQKGCVEHVARFAAAGMGGAAGMVGQEFLKWN